MSNGSAIKQFECIAPILRVADLAVSTNYYVNSLGFKVDWEYREGDFAISCVSRDVHAIYLCEGPQGNPGTWVWIGVENVDRLFEEYVTNSALILTPPTNYPWAREMHVTDPDRHVLRIGSEPLTNQE